MFYCSRAMKKEGRKVRKRKRDLPRKRKKNAENHQEPKVVAHPAASGKRKKKLVQSAPCLATFSSSPTNVKILKRTIRILKLPKSPRSPVSGGKKSALKIKPNMRKWQPMTKPGMSGKRKNLLTAAEFFHHPQNPNQSPRHQSQSQPKNSRQFARRRNPRAISNRKKLSKTPAQTILIKKNLFPFFRRILFVTFTPYMYHCLQGQYRVPLPQLKTKISFFIFFSAGRRTFRLKEHHVGYRSTSSTNPSRRRRTRLLYCSVRCTGFGFDITSVISEEIE